MIYGTGTKTGVDTVTGLPAVTGGPDASPNPVVPEGHPAAVEAQRRNKTGPYAELETEKTQEEKHKEEGQENTNTAKDEKTTNQNAVNTSSGKVVL
jgi:hypothetical protein